MLAHWPPLRLSLSPYHSRWLRFTRHDRSPIVRGGLWIIFLFAYAPALAQTSPAPASFPLTIDLPRDSVRRLFGLYEFEPQFKMRIFSENRHLFAQRLGDADRFEIFPKSPTTFFLKAMPAQLVFRSTASGPFDQLELHQGGKVISARRLESQPDELYDTILQLDSLMYQAYNERNLPQFMAYLAPNLEFYHDQTGRSNYEENRERFQTNFTRPTRMRRQLASSQVEVYPIPGFGAIQLGTHLFYQTDPGQAERLVARPRFLHVWKHTNNSWTIVRIVSYDH